MGDIVACEPVSRYLRQRDPDAEITWAVKEAFRELVDYNPHIDRTLSINCLSDWIRVTESTLFDEIFDLHVNGRMCPIWGKVLKKKNGDPDVDIRRYFMYGGLLASLSQGAGLPPLEERPQVYIPEFVTRSVDALALPGTYVVIHGTSNEICKDWPAAKWMTFVRHFTEKTGIPVVEVGTESICGALEVELGGRYINLCGRLSILETAEVIRRASLFAGIDSGPGHLANAVATYGVILLGEYRIYKKYMPYSGDYASGRNAALLYSKGPAAELSEAEVLEAVLRHFSKAADEEAPAQPRTLQAVPSEAGGLAALKRMAEFHLKVEGRIEEALRIYHQVLVDHPDDVDALLAFGKICTDLNRPEDAVPFTRGPSASIRETGMPWKP